MTYKEYYVVFTQGTTHWITKFLRKDFSHIFLLTRDKYNWLLLNPTRLYLQWEILPISADTQIYDVLPHLTAEKLHALQLIFSKRDDLQQYGTFGLLNCVTWTKYILGLRLNSITPFGLYKTMLMLDPVEREFHHLLSVRKVEYDRERVTVEQAGKDLE